MKVFVIFIANLLMFICLAQGASMNKDFDGNVANGLNDSDEKMIEYQSEEEASDDNEDEESQNPEEEDEEEVEDNEINEISRDAKADIEIEIPFGPPPPPASPKCRYRCIHNIKAVGCFRDKHIKGLRPMPSYLLSMRSKHSHVYAGFTLNWHDYTASLKRFLCYCSGMAAQRRHKYFGIQNYGECWSGNGAQFTYKRDGISSDCVNTSFKKCDLTKDCKCTGKQNANFVYKIY